LGRKITTSRSREYLLYFQVYKWK